MSKTTIPVGTRLLLVARAAGRCEYRGCNRALTQDQLTRRTANFSAFAHIVADSPDGPRGHPTDSARLAKDIENIMLLCLVHHRMIDSPEHWAAHPTPLLQEMKKEHEDRISRLSAITGQNRTHLVLMSANIGARKGVVSLSQAFEAVLPMYAVDDGTTIDLANLRIEDGQPIAWEVGKKEIDRAVATDILPRVHRGDAKHVSIFALAPIPLLMYLGHAVGDIASGVSYQRHRATEDWLWKLPAATDQQINLHRCEFL